MFIPHINHKSTEYSIFFLNFVEYVKYLVSVKCVEVLRRNILKRVFLLSYSHISTI